MNEINPLIWKLERQEIYSLLMEERITPKLNGASDRSLGITKVAWSPKNLISPSQCALAIVTTTGTLKLLHKVFNEWHSICNVSSFWLDIVQDKIRSNLNNGKKSRDSYATIIENLRQLQACSMTWSELFTLEEIFFAYLLVAHCSGEISVWKIPRITNFCKSLQPKLVCKIDPDVRVSINVLCWVTIDTYEHLLVVGYIDGRICAVKLTRVDNDLRIASMEQYVDPDHISIDCLCIASQDKSSIKILATKGPYLLLLRVDSEGVLRNMRYLQAEGFNITGRAFYFPI